MTDRQPETTEEENAILGHADEWADWTPAGCERAADMLRKLAEHKRRLTVALTDLMVSYDNLNWHMAHDDDPTPAVRSRMPM